MAYELKYGRYRDPFPLLTMDAIDLVKLRRECAHLPSEVVDKVICHEAGKDSANKYSEGPNPTVGATERRTRHVKIHFETKNTPSIFLSTYEEFNPIIGIEAWDVMGAPIPGHGKLDVSVKKDPKKVCKRCRKKKHQIKCKKCFLASIKNDSTMKKWGIPRGVVDDGAWKPDPSRFPSITTISDESVNPHPPFRSIVPTKCSFRIHVTRREESHRSLPRVCSRGNFSLGVSAFLSMNGKIHMERPYLWKNAETTT
ncbi:hypothetical protein K504DRAFT_40798 [Pleomassaria siparia CBS 279.74]|uniref:Uncharacterized protein n=1 Tax=Pleomassaria siparia CBS 279.74 TaxID=1314801 RepID=A0A6G1K5D4_9PLEO|nr:hypothetical protein K504DRAFT_40798 [Pleomassaria siparia CBS 279.74]